MVDEDGALTGGTGPDAGRGAGVEKGKGIGVAGSSDYEPEQDNPMNNNVTRINARAFIGRSLNINSNPIS